MPSPRAATESGTIEKGGTRKTMRFRLGEVAAAIGSTVPGGLSAETWVEGWSVDSRSLAAGDLFFALRGPNFDGARFIPAAFESGAVAAVGPAQDASQRVLVVPDVQEALGKVAAWARAQWGGDVVGVTGSAGKTSTKDIIAALLAEGMEVGKTEGNLNNEVGVPLTLLRLKAESRAAVIEMGMNHAGEIRRLAALARPRIGVVTNVGTAHIENFDSIEGIALAKRELIDSLPAGGVAVLNADDARVAAFATTHAGRCVLYGFGENAEVRATHLVRENGLTRFEALGTDFETELPGEHAVRNILAGLAVAREFGIEASRLSQAVRCLRPARMRGERIQHQGILIFNDCYNSNPEAARVMLDLLAETPARRRIAVLGEMLELGRLSERLHRDVGIHAAKTGVAVLVGIRGAARAMVDASVEAGLPPGAAVFFDEPAPAGDYVRHIAREGDAILFKGSRGTRVELALERLLA